jgi:hypothetical protein
MSPYAACFEFSVEYGALATIWTVAVDVSGFDWSVDVFAVGVTWYMCPPLQVVTMLMGEAYLASSFVAKDGVQLTE